MIPIIEIFSLATNAIIGTGITAGTLPVINTAVVTTTTTQIATTVITQNQNVNVFTSINSGGSNHLTDQMSGTMPKSKFQKILATIMKILCGLMIAIFIVNVFIYIFQLGANHLRAEMIGSGENTTKVGWFKIILRKLDILAMIGDGIGWLTEEEKVKKLSQAEADGWVELSPSQRIGPVPTFAPERYRLTAKYQKAVNLMGDGPRGSGMSQEKAAKLYPAVPKVLRNSLGGDKKIASRAAGKPRAEMFISVRLTPWMFALLEHPRILRVTCTYVKTIHIMYS
jgi:hypothetical protein